MSDFSLQDTRAKLESDTSGLYKKWLLEKLREYKSDLTRSKQQLLKPDEYNRLEHLDRALDAAILAVSKSSSIPGKKPVNAESNIFDIIF